MSDIERISYSYRSSYDNRAALLVAELKRFGWRGQVFKWSYYVCVALALLIEFGLLKWFLESRNLSDIGFAMLKLGVAATILAMFLALSVHCKVQRLIGNAMSREAGIREGIVSAEGVVETRGAYQSHCGWAGIIGVERMPKLTLLLLGDGMGYIIPHESLQDRVTADTLHERINSWRKAAQ